MKQVHMFFERWPLIGLIIVIVLLALGLFWLVNFDDAVTPPKQGGPSGAFYSLVSFGQQRVHPHDTMPEKAHYAAFEYSQNELEHRFSKSTMINSWESIGPHNIGGRTLVISINPEDTRTLYAGSASGGLWRSYSAGEGADAWDRISTGYPILGVSSIAIVPSDTNTMYIGTGEVYNYGDSNPTTSATYRYTRGSYGLGILKTTDAGETWEKSLDWSYEQARGIWAVRVDPHNHDVVWTATTEGTYKSIDAGASWTKVHDVIMAMDLVINPQHPDTVYISCGDFGSEGLGIYRTFDGGESWTKLENGLPSIYYGKGLLSIYESSPNILYASIGNGFWDNVPPKMTWLCRTEDHGETWAVVNTLDYSRWQGWYGHDVAVNPMDDNHVMTAGIDIWKSTDGGETLVQESEYNLWYFGRILPGEPEGPPDFSHADHHDIVFHPTNPDTIYFTNDGGVFRSNDGGHTFEGLNGGYQTQQFYNGTTSSSSNPELFIGGFQDNASAIYDGQVAWIRVSYGDGGWTGIHPDDNDVMYTSAQWSNMWRSTDGGTNWLHVLNGYNTWGESGLIAPIVFGVDDPNVIYVGRSLILKSFDGGDVWYIANGGEELDGHLPLSMAVAPQNSDIVYVGTTPNDIAPGNIWRSLDGGSNWTIITGSLPDRFYSELVVDPVDEAIVYVALAGFGSPHIYRSVDFGANWESIDTGLPDVPTTAIAIDPEYTNHIYVGNDLGVYVSVDDGVTWDAFLDGLPEAVLAMDLSISPVNRKLRVATHGNGAYERDLIGANSGATFDSPVITGIDLRQNYPNPFNASTKIEFELPKAETVTLNVYDINGRLVNSLIDGVHHAASSYQIIWNGQTITGENAASGIYIYSLRTDGGILKSRMMTLAR